MTAIVQVHAPSRLHFGMFSFGHAHRAQFGGVGAMIEPPCVEVTISPAVRFTTKAILTTPRKDDTAEDSLRIRTVNVVSQLATSWNLPSLPACEVDVRSPRDHTGLGVGTQLSLAIATGLRRFLKMTELPVIEIAEAVGRGARSAVGTYGFQRGGLIVDSGKESIDRLGTLAEWAPLPETWRFVLVGSVGARGLSGPSEAVAFERLPAVSEEIRRELWTIAIGQMLPAVARRDCDSFGAAVYRFGRRAGECFSAIQGGPFASTEISQLVESIREFGVPGVGQSSWGPTVFAVVDGDDEAQRLVNWLRGRNAGIDYEFTIAKPNNCGAIVEG